MAKRRLEAPDIAFLADMEAGFAAKPAPDLLGLSAPITQVAGDAARAAEPFDTETRIAMAHDARDALAWREAESRGAILLDVPLDEIVMEHLVRDRMVVSAEAMDELKVSIRANGLRAPIEVMVLANGKYGLISGWRRVTALRDLVEEGGPATARAILRSGAELGATYTAMVEENELRAQLSPYERGRICVVAADRGAFSSPDAAVEAIFAAASKAKRSKIRSFALIHEELGDMLTWPTDLSERNGLRLAHALRHGAASSIRFDLVRRGREGAASEWAVMEPYVIAAEEEDREPERGGRPKGTPAASGARTRRLDNGIRMDRVTHEDGYSIRFRGKLVDGDFVDLMMEEIQRLLKRRA